MSDEGTKNSSTEVSKFNFFYEKSYGYRGIHADGFIVSPNAKGSIAVTFYSERLAIPKHVELDFGNGEDSPEERVIEGKSGAVRQMEFTAFIDPETAEELCEWLKRAISAITIDDDDDGSDGGSE